MQHEPEIVKVIDEHRLIDAESYERSYRTSGVQALAPGFYVVCWPDAAHQAAYDEGAKFVGPYDLYESARLEIESIKRSIRLAAGSPVSNPAR